MNTLVWVNVRLLLFQFAPIVIIAYHNLKKIPSCHKEFETLLQSRLVSVGDPAGFQADL